ncbi:apolipoprotein N-acyltransferase [Haloferula helveola]|uniref:Apolipoprotein N-acyltransferase n=1 Tax=Haloferula helveola TaxID=490095 RepID=A0ABM7RJ13_9BACT|nr:apolipoprotein N-acyltransferase [Haloferula helveola]
MVVPVVFLFSLKGARPDQALVLGGAFGLALYGGTLNWFAEIFGLMAVLLFFILALFPTIFAVVMGTLGKRKLSPWTFASLVAVLWTGIEFYRCEWFTLRFPWITTGTALPPGYLTPILGVYGVTFAATLGAGLVVFERSTRIAGVAVLTALAATCYLPRKAPTTTDLRIAAVQGETLPFRAYLQLSDEVEGGADAFVWPEYALPYDLRKHPAQLEQVRELLVRHGATFLVVGSRTDHDDGSWSNTSLIAGRDGILGTHDKNRPVHFFDEGVPGTETPAWATPLGRIATPICFDNDYSRIPLEAVRNGAELFLVPSMDAEHWTARQHLQHAELVRHRAAETGRWYVVASSSGLTQVVDPTGARIDSLPLFDPGVMMTEVATTERLTIFSRGGHLFGPATAIAAAVILVGTLFLGRADRKKSPGSDSTEATKASETHA